MSSSSVKSNRKGGPKKGGFRLKALPEDAYKGQQQKLKQNLIQKAKLKKNYARILRQEPDVDTSPKDVHQSRAYVVAPEHSLSEYVSDHENQSDIKFTNFEAEPEENASKHGTVSGQDQIEHKDKSYRQRMKARKADSSATNAATIRRARTDERLQKDAKISQIQERRQHRTEVMKRETSRTKKGQPLMKDRIKNILDKLQAD